MKKVLFILGSYLPKPSANGVCVEKVVNELINNGYEVTCLVNNELNSNSEDKINGVKIYRIKKRLIHRVIDWHETKKNSKYRKIFMRMMIFLNRIKQVILIPFWPMISPLYSFRIYKKAKQLHDETHFDAIISVYTPIDTLIAGFLLKKKYKKFIYIPYFLDSLSGGYGPRFFSKSRVIKIGQTWENILLRNADKIISMESSKKHHEMYNINKEYFRNMQFLDIPLLTFKDGIKSEKKILDNNYINCVYVGSIYYPIRDPRRLLEIIEQLRDENVRFTFVGPNNCPHFFENTAKKMGKKIKFIDRVSHEVADQIMSEADILINIGNSNNSMVPSKIFEYISHKKPIISTYSIDDEPCIPYLTKYPAVLLVDERIKNNEELINQIKSFIQTYKKNEISNNELLENYYNNTPNSFYQMLDNLLKVEVNHE